MLQSIPQICNNKLKFPPWVFCLPPYITHDASCIMLNIDWTPLVATVFCNSCRLAVKQLSIPNNYSKLKNQKKDKLISVRDIGIRSENQQMQSSDVISVTTCTLSKCSKTMR